MAKRAPTPVAEVEEAETTTNGDMSKMDMVVEALENGHSTAKTGVPFLDQRFPGHGISPSYFSICKSNHNKKQEGGSNRIETMHPVGDFPKNLGADMVAIRKLIETAGGSEQLKDLAGTIGQLVQRYGVSNFNSMIDALS